VDTQRPAISAPNGDEVGSTLNTNNGSWENNPTSYTYQWERCNTSGAECEVIGGATLPSYTLGNADLGRTIRVTVTAANPGGHASAVSATTLAITKATTSESFTMPSPVVAPTISGSPVIGAVLTANNGTWSGTSPITYSYEWVDCFPGTAPSLNTCKLASNGSGAAYTVTTNDVGYSLAVIVTATNSFGAKSEYSKTTASVAATTAKEGTAALASKSFKVSVSGRHDYITIIVSCKSAACHGSLSLSYRKGKHTLIGGTARYSANSSGVDKVKLTLSSALAKLLRSHHNLSATLGVHPGTSALHTYGVTLHLKK
jgi:hypothetical protein